MLKVTVTGDRDVARAMSRFARMAGDLTDAHREIEQAAEKSMVELVPVLSGALLGSLHGEVGPAETSLTIGEGLEYAGVQEGGWPAHNIEGHGFMAAGQRTAEEDSRGEIEEELNHLIRLARLGY